MPSLLSRLAIREERHESYCLWLCLKPFWNFLAQSNYLLELIIVKQLSLQRHFANLLINSFLMTVVRENDFCIKLIKHTRYAYAWPICDTLKCSAAMSELWFKFILSPGNYIKWWLNLQILWNLLIALGRWPLSQVRHFWLKRLATSVVMTQVSVVMQHFDLVLIRRILISKSIPCIKISKT